MIKGQVAINSAIPNSALEDEFLSIINANPTTHYIASDGTVRRYCFIRRVLNSTGIIKWGIIRAIFRSCNSESIIEAKLSLQRKITTYESSKNGSQHPLNEQMQLVQGVTERFNQFVQKIRTGRARDGQSQLPAHLELPIIGIRERWSQIALAKGELPSSLFDDPAARQSQAPSASVAASASIAPINPQVLQSQLLSTVLPRDSQSSASVAQSSKK